MLDSSQVKIRNIPIIKIKNIAPEKRLNPLRVLDIFNKIKNGEQIKPIHVKAVEHGFYWLKDGSHRIAAYKQHGWENIPAELV